MHPINTYFSLAKAHRMARTNNMRGKFHRLVHIPEDGVVLSPYVNVFRAGTEQGYGRPAASKSYDVAVLSIAMPNKNYRMNDCPIDYSSGKEYETMVKSKFKAMMRGAMWVNADVLVVPDIGCGLYQNDPLQVGHLLGTVLNDFSDCELKVILTGSSQFCSAVRHACDCSCPIGSQKRKTDDDFTSFNLLD